MEKNEVTDMEKTDEMSIQDLIEEIRSYEELEYSQDLQEALDEIEADELASTDAVCLTVLGNYQAEDGFLNRLLEELYDQAYQRALMREEGEIE